MAAPIPHRTSNSQRNVGAFPPPAMYRDTLGLQPINDRRFSDSISTMASDDESATTKSTVRTTMNIYQPIYNNPNRMAESQYTDATASYHVEQILTNQVLIHHARALLILTFCAFGSAVQLMMFAVICLFFDGSPYKACLVCSAFFIFNASLLLFFIQRHHSRELLVACCCTTSLMFVGAVALFFWTAYLVYGEDKHIRSDNFDFSKADLLKTNHIVTNTRVALYSLHMILAPIQAVCCAAILYILCQNIRLIEDGKVSRGYFFSKPMGHQNVLVPIELKQVRTLEFKEDLDNLSIGVQTSGTQRDYLA